MTALEIGPDTVRVVSGGYRPIDPVLVRAALEWIDDPVGLYDQRPVVVAELWRAIMATAARGDHSLTLVHPDDWPRHRIERVVAAANAVADEVVAVPRGQRTVAIGHGTTPSIAPGTDSGARTDAPSRGRRFRLLPAASAVTAILMLAGAAILIRSPRAQTVVEGRVEVRIPADWTLTRVTGGPGSRRLLAAPPADPDLALHLTQSYAPGAALARVAGDFRRLIAEQPVGVFVDFRAEAQVAGRPAVTYREIRPGRVIDWSVVLVGSTLIGIGCQSPPQRTGAVRTACEQAVASASESGAF